MRASIRLAVTVVSVFLGGYTANGGERAKRQPETKPGVLDEFCITSNCTSPLALPVEFAGRKLSAILDTGCTVTVFDDNLRPLLGTPKEVRQTASPTGKVIVERFPAPEFRIGRIDVAAGAETVGCSDLAALSNVVGHDIRLLIGMDVLKGRVIQIDFPNGKLSFLRDPPSNTSGAIPIKYFGGTPWIAGIVDAAADKTMVAYFQIDTGACDDHCLGTLAKSLFEDLRSRGSLIPLRGRGVVTVNGATVVRSGRLTTPFFIANRPYPSAIFSEQSYCSVGLAFLCCYTVTFDFVNDVAYFESAGGPFNRFGLQTAWQNRELVVVSVAKGGRGEAVGILEGDVISSLNGIGAREGAERLLREEAETPGKAHVLSIRRGRKSVEASFAPVFAPLDIGTVHALSGATRQ